MSKQDEDESELEQMQETEELLREKNDQLQQVGPPSCIWGYLVGSMVGSAWRLPPSPPHPPLLTTWLLPPGACRPSPNSRIGSGRQSLPGRAVKRAVRRTQKSWTICISCCRRRWVPDTPSICGVLQHDTLHSTSRASRWRLGARSSRRLRKR